MLDKFKYLSINDANTPFDSSITLLKNNSRIVAQLDCANAIGSLMYAMLVQNEI